MGRLPLDESEKKKTMIDLVEATRELIFSKNHEKVSVRRIASRAKVNSATIYTYFADLEELILIASFEVFRDYCTDLIHCKDDFERCGQTDHRKLFVTTWRLFCKYAFAHPDLINSIFYVNNADKMKIVVEKYYSLHPERLEGQSEFLKHMLSSADLRERNLSVLRPVVGNAVSEEKLRLINDLMLAYFKSLIEEKIKDARDADKIAFYTEKMLSACRLLLELTGKDRED